MQGYPVGETAPFSDYMQAMLDKLHPNEFRVFNQGVGMVIFVAAEDADRLRAHLEGAGEKPFEMGEVVAGDREVRYR